MADYLVTRALPNPSGKDRSRHGANNSQLVGEWVEFQNATYRLLTLDGLSLYHQTFNHHCQSTGSEHLTSFTGSLGAGQSIRVHTGSGQGFWEGQVFHFFLGRSSFVWNNDCGDSVALQASGSVIDWASYGPRPVEGSVLNRVPNTNRLT